MRGGMQVGRREGVGGRVHTRSRTKGEKQSLHGNPRVEAKKKNTPIIIFNHSPIVLAKTLPRISTKSSVQD